MAQHALMAQGDDLDQLLIREEWRLEVSIF
jgi:hypothetical protein